MIVQPTGVVKHVHLQIRFIDEAFVARLTFYFGFRLMIANRVELQRALRLEELIADVAHVRFLRRMSVLKVRKDIEQLHRRLSGCLPNVSEDLTTWKSSDYKLRIRKVSRLYANDGEGLADNGS